MSSFLFTVCQVGAEPALKKEVVQNHPELRFAYSRPGFVTFKSTNTAYELDGSFVLKAVFARAYGISDGKTGDPVAIYQAAHDLAAKNSGRQLRLHVWERDQYAPSEEPKGFEPGAWAQKLFETLKSHDPENFQLLFMKSPVAEPGDLVFDLVAVEEGEWWFGHHTHAPQHSAYPGGRPVIGLPPEAPSRAFLKMEEGILRSGFPVHKGDTAVEIGSAPGGASYALLKRGVNVVGIDPAEMDPVVKAFSSQGSRPSFLHVQRPVNTVLRESLPQSIQWIVLDMNVAPSVSLFAVDRLAHRTRDTLLGLMLTVKLNEWKFADEIPGMLEHLKAMGLLKPRAVQLAYNRQEVFLYGLTYLGTRRIQA